MLIRYTSHDKWGTEKRGACMICSLKARFSGIRTERKNEVLV
jgi:hypothetical protein